MGTMESTLLRPVWTGSLTERRGRIPGALSWARLLALVLRGPLPSMGLPRASTTRPRSSGPTGTSTCALVSMLGCIMQQHDGKMTYNLSGTLHSLTLLDETVGTEQHNTDLAGFKVHAHALDARSKPVRVLETS
ncbi:hypothetical protein BJX70DRAFT_266102 [Aspergillus crustosus]